MKLRSLVAAGAVKNYKPDEPDVPVADDEYNLRAWQDHSRVCKVCRLPGPSFCTAGFSMFRAMRREAGLPEFSSTPNIVEPRP